MTSDSTPAARVTTTIRNLLITGTACAALAGCDPSQNAMQRDAASGSAAAPAMMIDINSGPDEPAQRATLPPAAAGDEDYADTAPNPVKSVAEAPVSTFSVDVDTFAYANVRRFITGGQLPPKDAVRIEEMINYFDYDYALPSDSRSRSRRMSRLLPTPWNANAAAAYRPQGL